MYMSVTVCVCLEYVHACMSRSTCSCAFFLSRLDVKSRSRSNLGLSSLCSLPMGWALLPSSLLVTEGRIL